MKKHVKKAIQKLTAENLFAKPDFTHWRTMTLLIVLIASIVGVGVYYQLDELAVAGVALVVAVVSGAFVWVVSLIGLVPIVGPLVIKILSIPLVWLINGIGYVISFVAIRRGYSQDVLTYRGLTITLIVGIVIGFVICSLIM
ncbi:MAG TPA: hypothetical protein VK967_00885 [Methylotenera sp.]|nr:hypothetical protein [Methylotenera sp.]